MDDIQAESAHTAFDIEIKPANWNQLPRLGVEWRKLDRIISERRGRVAYARRTLARNPGAVVETASASAEGTPQQREDCMADAFKFCSSKIPFESQIEECL